MEPIFAKPVSTKVWRRLVNRLVDLCAVMLILAVATIAATLHWTEEEAGPWIEGFRGTLAILGTVVLYYCVAEGLTGRTLGKVVTRTRVVDEQGRRPPFGRVVARSLLRIVPFEWIGLFEKDRRTLHDFGSKTYVVDIERPAYASLSPDHE